MGRYTLPSVAGDVPIYTSPNVPPNRAYVIADDFSRAGGLGSSFTAAQIARSDEIVMSADLLNKISSSPLTVSDIKSAMDEFGKLTDEKVKAVLDMATERRARQIGEVRARVFALLRPVVEEDMSDAEVRGLTNAVIAQIASLGGQDVQNLYGVPD